MMVGLRPTKQQLMSLWLSFKSSFICRHWVYIYLEELIEFACVDLEHDTVSHIGSRIYVAVALFQSCAS